MKNLEITDFTELYKEATETNKMAHVNVHRVFIQFIINYGIDNINSRNKKFLEDTLHTLLIDPEKTLEAIEEEYSRGNTQLKEDIETIISLIIEINERVLLELRKKKGNELELNTSESLGTAINILKGNLEMVKEELY